MPLLAIDLIGWLGGALLVVSIIQSRISRLRTMNLIASLILTAYNAIVGVWPMVAMNGLVAAINVYYLIQIRRSGQARGGLSTEVHRSR